MGLGNRSAKRHETAGAQKIAGVDPQVYWDYQPGQAVMTVDGFPGKVVAVYDGPFAGNEEYEVRLDNGLGGGIYTSGQLRGVNNHAASMENTAAQDYPELAEILSERPDIAKYPDTTLGSHASLQVAAAKHPQDHRPDTTGEQPGIDEDGHLTWGGRSPGAREAELDDNAMVVNEGDHKPQDVEAIEREAGISFGLRMIEAAKSDPDLHFQITAAWRDVRNKAQRIRREGGVHITTVQNGYVIATVQGDHGTYESAILRAPGTQKVGQWDCGCLWAKYHWGAPDDYSRFAGRMCSHALALHYEAQSRGMLGREIQPNKGLPRWLLPGDKVQTSMDRAASLADPLDETFVQYVARLVQEAAINSPFGEPDPSPVPALPGPTEPHNPGENPASAGFLTSPDPSSWSSANPSIIGDRVASLYEASYREDAALFEPEISKEAFLPLLMEMLPAVAEGAGGASAAAEAGGAAGEAAGTAKGLSGLPKGVRSMPDFGKQFDQQVQQDQQEGDAAMEGNAKSYQQQAQNPWHEAILHDEPEPALPTTEGADEDEGLESHEAASSIPTGQYYSMPADTGTHDPIGEERGGPGLIETEDDALSPQDVSIQSHGSTQPSSIEEIVAQFQRTAGATSLMSAGPREQADGMDLAAAARAHLAKTAMANFSPAEQQELINEGENVRAANLDRLQIEGTHYESLEAVLANQDEDEDTWMV